MNKFIFLVVMCLFGASAYAQESLGDIARAERAKKHAGTPAIHLDDDTTQRSISPETTSTPPITTAATTPAADASAKPDDKTADAKSPDAKSEADKSSEAKSADDKGTEAKSTDAKDADTKDADVKSADAKEQAKKNAAAQKQKEEDLKKEIDAKKQEVAMLQRELDLAQREARLRAAAYYADAGTMLRDQAKFAEDSRKEQAEMDDKKQALAAAQQKLSDLQEDARKAGLPIKSTE